MEKHSCGLAEAAVAVSKSVTSARDTALGSLEALVGGDHAAMAKFLDTAESRELYKSYSDHSEEQPQPMAKVALDALAEAHRITGESKWAAMNKALATRLGQELYKHISEAA